MQLDQSTVDHLVIRIAVILQLEEVVLAKDLAIAASRVACSAKIRLEDGSRRLAAVARTQRDESASVFSQQRPIDPRLVVVPLQAGSRDQLEQVVIALHVLGQQDQVKVVAVLAADFVGHAAWADVCLDADDRLDASVAGI